jgi:membrane-bound lytic murein transglycosylase B
LAPGLLKQCPQAARNRVTGRAAREAVVKSASEMSKSSLFAIALAVLAAALPITLLAQPAAVHPGQEAFVRELVEEAGRTQSGLTRASIERTLANAKYQQSIIDAISRPAEKTKPWRDYRPIFITGRRIEDGIAFLRENRALLDPIAQKYGVPAEIIVAIIGVETSYGRNIGKYRVLDALVTLAFYYPPRAAFFRSELKQLFLLPGAQFPQQIDQLVGSYAGAMGWGQFMPTSYAKYARDHDADGLVDLWNTKADIFASIANYFIGYGWETGAPIAHRATPAAGRRTLTPEGYEPVYTVGDLAKWGYPVQAKLDPALPATLVELQGEGGPEYWVTHRNFFVITRYNRSPMYAMAVKQLSEAIAAGAKVR